MSFSALAPMCWNTGFVNLCSVTWYFIVGVALIIIGYWITKSKKEIG